MDNRNDTPIDDFEQHLRDQLAPRSAPAGFADRVMARAKVRVAPQPRPRPFFLLPLWSWTAVAALLVVAVFGGIEHDRRQRIEGERARAQVLLALRITGTTLHDVQQKISTEENTPAHSESTGFEKR
ncbi:MAG TPA: hypothetical protein VMD25_12880 [Acidobacteriaceae bacterium]|nr:hypothetical protein [Acidobacteriaceae bacterium]